MNKLFGESATGFGGGQDALENYNAIVEQIRQDAQPVLTEIIDLRMMQLFGFIPEYTIKWKPLKVLDGVQEEQVKTSVQNRILEQFKQRLITGKEASTLLQREDLLPIDTEVSEGIRDVDPMDMIEASKPAGPEEKKSGKNEK